MADSLLRSLPLPTRLLLKGDIPLHRIFVVTSILWNENELNMVDTPGHADFGSEVPRFQRLEPIEEVTIEVNDEHVGLIMEALSHRRAEVIDMGPVPGNFGRTRLSLTCPSRGLVGYRSVFSSDTRGTGFMHRAFLTYEKYRGPLGNVRKGVLVSMGYGTITAHALMSLEARGTLFVTPGMETYDGMIVGEHSRDTDLDINPSRAKELTNVRAASKDENVKLSPPRLMTLEEAIGYVASDELIEVTPKAIQLRKKYLDVNKRKTMS